MSDRANVLSMIKDHITATQHDSNTRATRIAITKEEFLADKESPESSEEIRRLQIEIDDIRSDLALQDSLTDELIVRPKTPNHKLRLFRKK